MRCSIQETRLYDAVLPLFETISYHWGDPRDQVWIELNGLPFHVPRTAASALVCMRHCEYTRVLWIDAVCINQGDKRERADQIALMKDIYSRSGGNLIYLGEEDSSTCAAILSIYTILEEIRADTKEYTTWERTLYTGDNSRRYSDCGLRCRPDKEALVSLFSRSWFR